MLEADTPERMAAVMNAQRFLDRPRTVPHGCYDNPEHPLHGQPLVRRSTGLLEVECSHGTGHPIPESIEWMDAFGPPGAKGSWGIHGCDGDCS